MFILLTTLLCVIQMLAKECKCSSWIDLPSDSEEPNRITTKTKYQRPLLLYRPIKLASRNLHVRATSARTKRWPFRRVAGPPRRDKVKEKIGTLTRQAVLDSNRTIVTIQDYRKMLQADPEYRLGFLLCKIKKERSLMDQLFDLAVKYRDYVTALQHLKVFEYIMRANVNITILVKQMAMVHLSHRDSLPSTTSAESTFITTEGAEEGPVTSGPEQTGAPEDTTVRELNTVADSNTETTVKEAITV